MSVTFTEKWGAKSWKVSYSGKYKNERIPHVETQETNLGGKTFKLANRQVRKVKDNVAVMYDVVGVSNRNHVAHLTVYFGPEKGSEAY